MTTSPTIPRSSTARIHIQPSAVSPTPSSLRTRRSYPLSILLLLSTLLLSLITWYSYNSLTSPGTEDTSSGLATWGCGMSWMSPGYVKLDGPSDVNGLEKKYSIWWYREGGIDSPVHNPEAQPVLFIPGNAGSFKQVRSIASSAAHQYHQGPYSGREGYESLLNGFGEEEKRGLKESKEGMRELEFFAVDFNEEFSAFHSQTLLDQSLFVSRMIEYIRSLNPAMEMDGKKTDKKVWIVGHSMGGVVGRHAITRTLSRSGGENEMGTVNNLVDVVITMSTPHSIPPVPFDRRIERIYHEIETFWNRGGERELPILISICGGVPDGQISSDSCVLPAIRRSVSGLSSEEGEGNAEKDIDPGSFTVFTTGMDQVWTGTDHQAMVWCDQVRWRVARVLLEMTVATAVRGERSTINARYTAGEDERQEKVAIARRWLLGERKVALGRVKKMEEGLMGKMLTPSEPGFIHNEHRSTSYSISIPDSLSELQMMRSQHLSDLQDHLVSPFRLCEKQGQIWACDPLPIKQRQLLPPSPARSAQFPLPGRGVRADEGLVFMTVEIPQGKKGRRVVVDVAGPVRAVVAVVGGSYDAQGPWKPLLRSFSMPSHPSSALARRVTVKKRSECHASTHFSPIMEVRVSPLHHSSGSTYESHFYPSLHRFSTVHLHSFGPFLPTSEAEVKLLIWQDPHDDCVVLDEGISIHVDWVASTGLLVVRWRIVVLAWALGWGCLIMARQMREYRQTGTFPHLFESFEAFARHDLLRTVFLLLILSLLQSSPLATLIPHPEHLLLGTDQLLLIPLIVPMVLLSLGLVLVSAGVVVVGTTIGGWLLGWTRLLRFPRHADGQAHFQPRHLLSFGVLVLLVATFVPLQFAFLIAFAIHWGSVMTARKDESNPSRYNYYLSLLLLLFLLLPMNITVLIVWSRNLLSRWNLIEPFGSDHRPWFVGPVLGVCEMCVAGKMIDPSRSRMSTSVEVGLYLTAAYAFIYGGRFTYGIYELVMVVSTVLGVWHVMPAMERAGKGKR